MGEDHMNGDVVTLPQRIVSSVSGHICVFVYIHMLLAATWSQPWTP